MRNAPEAMCKLISLTFFWILTTLIYGIEVEKLLDIKIKNLLKRFSDCLIEMGSNTKLGWACYKGIDVISARNLTDTDG